MKRNRNLTILTLFMGWLAGQNVGIGTANPLTRLHVAAGDLFLGEVSGDNGFIFHSRAGNGYDFLQITSRTSGTWEWGKGITFVRSSGHVGIGNVAPTERLHIEGNLRLQGAFMPGNNAGTPGQVLRSAGPGTPPTWQTVYLYGGNTQSTSLTTTASTTNSAFSNLLTLNFTPVHPRVFIFASVGARLTNNAGSAQLGQALLLIRVLVNGNPVAGSKTVVTDYDDNNGVVTGGNAVIAGFPVNVTPGGATTVTLQWAVVRLWSNNPWQLRCEPGIAEDHAVLTVLD